MRKAVLRMTTIMDNLFNSSCLVECEAQFSFRPIKFDLRNVAPQDLADRFELIA